MFSKIKSAGIFGFEAEIIEVECDLSSGLPRFDIVGLPSGAVSEARERVRSAVKNCGLSFPISRITVNLAPAEFKKEGTAYDLPILTGILKASSQLKCELSDSALIGEISLSGEIRRINGVLPMVLKAKKAGLKKIYIPYDNQCEASLVPGIEIYPLSSVNELLAHLRGDKKIEPLFSESFDKDSLKKFCSAKTELDFSDVLGQKTAKRGLEIAAAGGHNILLIGSPGSGKSMLAKRLVTILPEMSFEEILESTAVYSVAGMLGDKLGVVSQRPFRAPHHTISTAALTGGGARAMPGEISLAHSGVLFLDELPLFPHSVLEALRQPLEENKITISRAAYRASYPASIILAAAMNPCPCGYLLDPVRPCTCTEAEKKRYLSKLSGPLYDRMDIVIQVDTVKCSELISSGIGTKSVEESSAAVRRRVNRAREIQLRRFKGTGISCNAQLSPKMLRTLCPLDKSTKGLLSAAYERLGLSARAYDKIIKTARTAADLEESEKISEAHILEAIQYRSLDRSLK